MGDKKSAFSHKQVPRFFQPPDKQSYFLFGPRGTGKSKFLKAFYKNAMFIDLLDDKTQLIFSTNPEKLEPIVSAMKNGDCLILDEVQKAPSLLAKIHQLIEDENFPDVQFIMTGSSSRKLKREGSDMMAGRALLNTMHPFMASELKSKFSLEKSLDLGLLPIVVSAEQPEKTLESYIAVYLREEVKQEGLVKNLNAFSRFLEAMSFSHGEVLNLSNVARDCAVKRTTVDGYLQVLEDLLIGYRIPSFKKRNRKSTIDSDKFYYFDAGVFNSLRSSGPLDPHENRIGAALEGLVLQNLRAWVAYRNKGETIFFWRTEAGNEVDFIVYGPKTFLAIEVKNTNKIQNDNLSGLKSFHLDYPEAECIFLYRGNTHEKYGDIDCIPIENYLLKLSIE